MNETFDKLPNFLKPGTVNPDPTLLTPHILNFKHAPHSVVEGSRTAFLVSEVVVCMLGAGGCVRALGAAVPHSALHRPIPGCMVTIREPMMKPNLVKVSKFLSYVLRHKPEAIGLELDEGGWASVEDLLNLANTSGKNITRQTIEEVVATNDKGRFAFNADQTKIRAVQGHSRPVDLALEPIQPPDVLFHGTATRFLDSIMETGLSPQNRQHVHLSATEETALKVGQRHGKPVVLKIDTATMHGDGFKFYLADNGVWLTDEVPVGYLSKPTDPSKPST